MRGEEGCGCRVLGLRVSARWGGGGGWGAIWGPYYVIRLAFGDIVLV